MGVARDPIRRLFGFLPARRPVPEASEVKVQIDLYRFLPFRIHRLAVGFAFSGERSAGKELPIIAQSHRLKVREWRILMLLGSLGPLTNAEISMLAGMDAGTISRAINRLSEGDWVISKKVPGDKRMILWALSTEGAKLFDTIAPQRLAEVEAVESCLSDEERHALLALLDKIEARIAELDEQKRWTTADWE